MLATLSLCVMLNYEVISVPFERVRKTFPEQIFTDVCYIWQKWQMAKKWAMKLKWMQLKVFSRLIIICDIRKELAYLLNYMEKFPFDAHRNCICLFSNVGQVLSVSEKEHCHFISVFITEFNAQWFWFVSCFCIRKCRMFPTPTNKVLFYCSYERIYRKKNFEWIENNKLRKSWIQPRFERSRSWNSGIAYICICNEWKSAVIYSLVGILFLQHLFF